jgi:ABC-2 type transport system ATP-binding protein
MSIIVQEITKRYGEQKALDNVSLSISSGEIVGLLGPNGAGKSTLMKIITCFIPPCSGTVSVNNYDIFQQAIEVKKLVGYLPENNPLYLEMYIKEYLLFIAGLHKITKPTDRVNEMINLTGLELEKHKKIGALSKGFRQRVGLAQALIHDPKVLILDEPTSGLDPNQLLDIRRLISNIGKYKTVMLSTHIMQEVEAVCNRAIIINRGKIVADDSTANLSRLATGSDLVRVEFDRPIEIPLLKKITGVGNVTKISGNSFELTTSSSFDIRPEIFKFAVQRGVTVLSMSRSEKSLEEVFQLLTQKQTTKST